jgi:hypothetical protein
VRKLLIAVALVLGGCTGGAEPDGVAPGSRGTVLFFVSTACDVTRQHAPEFNLIVQHYEPKGFLFLVVYVDPDVTPTDIARHMTKCAFRCPFRHDRNRDLTRRLSVTATPTAAVLDPEGKRLYRGRIDDRGDGPPTTRDLRDALDAVAAGRAVAAAETEVKGTAIKP